MKKPALDLNLNLNLSKKDAKLLFILLGIVILLVCYLAVYSPYTKKAEATAAEISSLQPTLTELRQHYASLESYKAGIEDAKDSIAGSMERYPASVRSEDLIMYAIRLEDKLGLNITSISFSEPTPIMTFQGVKEGEDGVSVTAADTYAYTVSMAVTFDLSYEEFKELTDFVAQTKERTALNNLAVSYDSGSGSLTGSATIDKFYVTDGADPYVATNVPNVELGRDDLFGTVETPEPQAAG